VLHDLNLEIVNAMNTVLKGSADEKPKKKDDVARNVEQLVLSAFKWENELGINTVHKLWESSAKYCHQREANEEESDTADNNNNTGYDENNNDDFKDVLVMFGDLEKGDNFVTMKHGAKTRWWMIGEAACILLHKLPMRKFMARNYDDRKITGKAHKTGNGW
jgi:hypothetical protein